MRPEACRLQCECSMQWGHWCMAECHVSQAIMQGLVCQLRDAPSGIQVRSFWELRAQHNTLLPSPLLRLRMQGGRRGSSPMDSACRLDDSPRSVSGLTLSGVHHMCTVTNLICGSCSKHGSLDFFDFQTYRAADLHPHLDVAQA